MKVLLVNGSSRPDGCTSVALRAVAAALEKEGIETETVFIGNQPMTDCIACGKCRELVKCVFDDIVNEIVSKAAACDGFVFGCPVYYAHPSARLLTVMDRAFYSGGRHFAFKPAAAVVSCRRGGASASFDVINKYFTINSMPVVGTTYWNDMHGSLAGQVEKDLEGLNTMTNLGKNMAWLLRCIDLGRRNGVNHPKLLKVYTHFIRE
ncbi:MAG: flavodoxin family protein [Clostridiales bacterium]|nr:flavodoxin family protein [Clostridiales bacterium]